ncbi:hypothetical protein [Aequorivita marisscotiae]|uniref:Uncharacterized protein n=1 Tax=Aequorivita marisscotiae TaxID=3040348 RepID=A0ABY8KVJ2_9FLAO|nr:hypothetical protein [Aequorivita sp. Ant34-E75]WGF92200.1 hypothetical protein QCQ61_13445 [Aequorivita sp. Ant34-E75]
MTAIGGAIAAEAYFLPNSLTRIAGYLIVAGTVASVVSQAVINDGNDDDDEYPPFNGFSTPGPNPLLDVNQ